MEGPADVADPAGGQDGGPSTSGPEEEVEVEQDNAPPQPAAGPAEELRQRRLAHFESASGNGAGH